MRRTQVRDDFESFKNMVRRLLKSFGLSDSSIEELLNEFEAMELNAVDEINNVNTDYVYYSNERLIDVIEDFNQVKVLIEMKQGDSRNPKIRLVNDGKGILVYLSSLPEYIKLNNRVTLRDYAIKINNGVLILTLKKAKT